ncbi:uncharacterized protein LOC125946251 isoform X1 [Dermacentor silvarum]|uniref:uncharacterized protein LOC125946251 isoform X1 n=1 Tax=Dermacentor silvarum TaxID=543639 RepID=UPI002100E0FD|nr:uncharacterized protein LOC125946251 isoform X1 [Dermacentor silvarum]
MDRKLLPPVAQERKNPGATTTQTLLKLPVKQGNDLTAGSHRRRRSLVPVAIPSRAGYPWQKIHWEEVAISRRNAARSSPTRRSYSGIQRKRSRPLLKPCTPPEFISHPVKANGTGKKAQTKNRDREKEQIHARRNAKSLDPALHYSVLFIFPA